MENPPFKERWVAASVSPGMFDSEYAVELALANGSEVSFFVDKSLIVERGGKFFLKVAKLTSASTPDKDLVLLPVETFETFSRWVEVRAE